MNYKIYLFNHIDKKYLPKTRDFVIVQARMCGGISVNSLN